MVHTETSGPTPSPSPAPSASSDFNMFFDQRLAAAGSSGAYFGSSSGISAESAAGITLAPSAWQVYLGTRSIPRQTKVTRGGTADNVVTVDQAAMQVYSWSDKQYDAWAKVLVANGLFKPGQYNRSDLQEAWLQAIPEAAKLYSIGGKKITPQKFIEMWAGANNKTDGPKTTTSTETSVQHFDDLDARAMANEVFTQMLGQEASKKQSAALQEALNAYATNHPQVTTRNQTVDADGNSTASTHSSGGVSAGGLKQIAEDQAMANPQYAEHQASTTLFNWLVQGIQSPVDV